MSIGLGIVIIGYVIAATEAIDKSLWLTGAWASMAVAIILFMGASK